MKFLIAVLAILACVNAAHIGQKTLSTASSSSWLNLLQLRVKSLAGSTEKGPIEELNAIIETIRARLNQEQTDANTAWTAADGTLAGQITTAAQNVEKTVADIGAVDAALQHDNAELATLTANMETNTQSIMTKDGEITALEGRIAAGASARSAQTADYNQKIADIDAVIAILDEIMTKANTGLSMLALKAKSTKVHSELKSLIQIVTSLGDKGDVDDLKRLVQMLKDELNNYKTRLTTQENERAAAWTSLSATLNTELTELRNMRQALVDANAGLAEQKTVVQGRINTNTEERSRLVELKAAQEHELTNLQNARETTRTEYQSSTAARRAQLDTLQQIQDLVNQRLITWAQHVAEAVSNVSVKVNCEMGAWSEWSVCPVCSDVPVTKSRSRSITTAPQYGGDACPAASETADCGVSACRQTGWQLAMVVKGASTTFNYDSAYWTNDATYDQDGNLKTNYFFSPFSSVRLEVGGRTMDIAIARDSLKTLFSGGQVEVGNARGDWTSLYTNGGHMQPNCNRGGFNVRDSSGWYSARVGQIYNNEYDCGSNDSGLGAGMKVNHPYGGMSGAAGSHVACCAPGPNGQLFEDTKIYVNVV